MSNNVKKYWAATPADVFEAGTFEDNGKVYYRFHGSELTYSDKVGEVLQAVTAAESGAEASGATGSTWMVFQFVPSPSETLAAAFAGAMGNLSEVKFRGRVYEKFTYPHPVRGARLQEAGAVRPSALLGDAVEQADDYESDIDF